MYRTSPCARPAFWGRLPALLALSLLCLLARPAGAWIETEVRGHQATVTVTAEGRAEVRHELSLRVRGGPLLSLEIEGVGSGVEVLGDATVRPAAQGSSQLWPLEPAVREDGVLVLDVKLERGLRSGVYRFEFAYQLDVFERGWLERKGDRARLTWVQPRFTSGIDSAKVVFRVPRTRSLPEIPSEEEGPASAVLLTEVRRGPELDEIELVRAHVARGEAAVWQVELSPATFPSLAEPVTVAAAAPGFGEEPPRLLQLPRTPWWAWSVGGALGLAYGLLLWAKWRAVRVNCARSGVKPRALVPLPAAVRITLSGLLLGAAAWLALAERPSWAGMCWGGGLLLAALLPPLRTAKARGPGEWTLLSEEQLAARPALPQVGRWLDAGTVRGAAVLSVLVLTSTAAAWSLLSRSPYHAGLLIVTVTGWLPIFLTGRAMDMPADAAWGALPLYRWLEKRLLRLPDVQVEYWARRPQQPGSGATRANTPTGGASDPDAQLDEIRLRVRSEGMLPGFRVLELGVEIGGGLVALPCVVVRVADDSPAYLAFSRNVNWVRGRRGEERVTVLRPRVPSRQQCLQLAITALRLLKGTSRPPRAETSSPGPTEARSARRGLAAPTLQAPTRAS